MNKRQHSEHSADGNVIVNMALAISSRDLYEQCKEEAIKSGLKNENIPSHSWFRFQFWLKNPYTHHALNYISRLKIHYMIQQRNVRKHNKDVHYCNTLYLYTREMILAFKEFSTFISTNDKNKIKVGEPNCPIAAVTQGKKVLVAEGQVLQAADHNFASITRTPTVTLIT